MMLGLYLILLISDYSRFKPKKTPINIAVVVFLLSFAISTFVGVDWYRSFWDNHERMLGLFTIFHFVLYYFIITSVARGWGDWKWLLRSFLFAGGIVMFLGLIQKINPEFLLNHNSNRVSATLGNAIYFSAFGLFLFSVGFLLFVKEKAVFWKVFSCLGGLFGFFGIFWGGTRGTFLGLLAGLFVLFFIFLVTLKGHKKIKLTMFAVAAAGVALLILSVVFRQTNFVRSIPTVGPLLNTEFSSGTAATRLTAWGIAVESWKEKPIFGWGPNNYYYAFNKFYRPESLEHGWSETWFDNAHSAAINTLNTQGAFGFLTYLGLFVVPLCVLCGGYRKGVIDACLLAFSSAFLVGHFTHNLFVFENPTSYLYFFFFLAFINSQSTDAKDLQMHRSQITDHKTGGSNFSFGLCIIVILFIAVLIYTTNVNPAKANIATLSAIRNLYSGPSLGVATYDKATTIPSPHIDDIRNDFSRTATEIISILVRNNKKTDDIKILFEKASSELQKNRLLHPMDIRVNLQQAQLYAIMAQETGDVKLLLTAESVLEEALLYSPKRQQIQYMLSMVKLQLGKYGESVFLLQASIDNDPKIGEGWWRLALVHANSGNNQKALEIIETAQDKGIQFDAQGQNIVSMITEASKKGN